VSAAPPPPAAKRRAAAPPEPSRPLPESVILDHPWSEDGKIRDAESYRALKHARLVSTRIDHTEGGGHFARIAVSNPRTGITIEFDARIETIEEG